MVNNKTSFSIKCDKEINQILSDLALRFGGSKADVVRRSLKIIKHLDDMSDGGDRIYVQSKSGTTSVLIF